MPPKNERAGAGGRRLMLSTDAPMVQGGREISRLPTEPQHRRAGGGGYADT